MFDLHLNQVAKLPSQMLFGGMFFHSNNLSSVNFLVFSHGLVFKSFKTKYELERSTWCWDGFS